MQPTLHIAASPAKSCRQSPTAAADMPATDHVDFSTAWETAMERVLFRHVGTAITCFNSMLCAVQVKCQWQFGRHWFPCSLLGARPTLDGNPGNDSTHSGRPQTWCRFYILHSPTSKCIHDTKSELNELSAPKC